MTKHTVVIVDDHALVRDGLRAVLDARPTLDVVGEAPSGEEAIAVCKEVRPDVVVMDLHLPGIGGTEATAQIVSGQLAGAVVVLTMFEDDESLVKRPARGSPGIRPQRRSPRRHRPRRRRRRQR